MKKILSFIAVLSVLLVAFSLASCENTNTGDESSDTTTEEKVETRDVNKDKDDDSDSDEESDGDKTEKATSEEETSTTKETTTVDAPTTDTPVNISHLLTDTFSETPFFDMREGGDTDEAEIKEGISQIPSDKYEAYPDTHKVPLSATLYKDGEAIEIAVDDERLIRLTNFFNNSVYYSKCAYAQSFLSLEWLEEHITSSDFRLELKYEPYGEEGPSPYGRCTTGCDAIIVSNDDSMFALIAHHMSSYDWDEEKYPFRIAGFIPLFGDYRWLELFGF